MRIPRLHQFCYCSSLKEGTIISSLFFIISNFLGGLVMLLLVSNEEILPVILGYGYNRNTTNSNIDVNISNSINRTTLVAKSSSDNVNRNDTITSLARVGEERPTTPATNDDSTNDNVTGTEVEPEYENEPPPIVMDNNGTSSLPADRAAEVGALRSVCCLLLAGVVVSLPVDVVLLVGGVRQRKRWLLVWLVWYLLFLAAGSVWTVLLVCVSFRSQRPVPMLCTVAVAQTLANGFGWYCYYSVLSFFIVLRERAARDLALMSLAPIM